MLTTIITKSIYVLIIYLLSFLFGMFYRQVLKLFKSKNITKRARNNINSHDRIFRMILGIILLIWGLSANSPLVIFFSGFCFFEAFSKWCGFNAILGKNTCDIN